jgi:hypothetical protein
MGKRRLCACQLGFSCIQYWIKLMVFSVMESAIGVKISSQPTQVRPLAAGFGHEHSEKECLSVLRDIESLNTGLGLSNQFTFSRAVKKGMVVTKR